MINIYIFIPLSLPHEHTHEHTSTPLFSSLGSPTQHASSHTPPPLQNPTHLATSTHPPTPQLNAISPRKFGSFPPPHTAVKKIIIKRQLNLKRSVYLMPCGSGGILSLATVCLSTLPPPPHSPLPPPLSLSRWQKKRNSLFPKNDSLIFSFFSSFFESESEK